MRILGLLFIGITVLSVAACRQTALQPPVAQVREKILEQHGDERLDEYYWLRDRDNPEVTAYLEAENDYTSAMLADVAELQETLYGEIVGRIKPDEASVPYLKNGYYYSHRFREGQEYRIYERAPASARDDRHTMLDVNQLADGHDYCSVQGLTVSPDNTKLAFAIDTVGRRKYTVRFIDLGSGEFLADEIAEVTGELVFANDSATVWYSRQDPETLRSYQIWRHRLGSDPGDDVLVYEEEDETFSVSVDKSMSDRWVLIASQQTMSSEYRVLDADRPETDPRLFSPRQRGLEYHIDHINDIWVIHTNFKAHDFCVMTAEEGATEIDSWSTLVPHRPGVFVDEVLVFNDFFAVKELSNGLPHIMIHSWQGDNVHEVEFEEEAYSVWFENNADASLATLRFAYSSLTTPRTVYEYDVHTQDRIQLKQSPVLGGFDPTEYQTRRLWAPARDGKQIPITLLSRKGVKLDGSNPALLYGYGSYGYTVEPSFSSPRLSLVDRGFVFAIAHVRGGQMLGRSWYEDGKLLHKKNTFFDFIDCARFLIDQGWTSADRLAADGGSAGGLLMGVIANLEPDLFEAIVAEVPWVDVVTTMLDDSIPLTTSEYDEWGNPSSPEFYDYMLSYSPYDNVRDQDYPNMLVTTGLHDSQVQYWEPAKWVARLRVHDTGDNMLLLKTDMGAGHSGKTGRFQEHEDTALVYAFILKALGLV